MPLRKTYTEMLNRPQAPEVCVTDKAMMGIPAGVKMLIPTPLEMKAYMEKIPSGKAVEIGQLRNDLAQHHAADVCCPLTAGIFLRIVAEAALEDLERGKTLREITPFWRVIKPKDKVAKKLRCGPEFVAQRRVEEGIRDG